MKGFRFYFEFANKTEKNKTTVKELQDNINELRANGNCVAVCFENGWYRSGEAWCMEAIGSVGYQPNGGCAGTSVSDEYIDENLKRIPEKLAREIHPNLFNYLDNSPF